MFQTQYRVFLNMTNMRNKETSMTETLSRAWSLFDAGNYTDAETLYKECYAKIPSTDHDNYFSRMTHLPAPQISTSRAMFP